MHGVGTDRADCSWRPPTPLNLGYMMFTYRQLLTKQKITQNPGCPTSNVSW